MLDGQTVWGCWSPVLSELARSAAAGPIPLPATGSRRGLDVFDGVGFIELEGALHRGKGLLATLFGGTNVDEAHGLFQAALQDDRVKGILLSVDSPGGTVGGIQEFAAEVARARGRKPIVAWTDGMMASAAYWLSSAADRIYISGDTTMVGSIGVLSRHVDVSGAEAARGIKTTEIYAGRYKTIGSPYGPLGDEGRQVMQEHVDGIYRVFVDAVAANRGVGVQRVLSGMADGRMFVGRSAIEAGLVDGVRTLDQAFVELRG